MIQSLEDVEDIKDPSAVINVALTTPILQTRDYLIRRSPMDAEIRDNVFTDVFLVLNNHIADINTYGRASQVSDL